MTMPRTPEPFRDDLHPHIARWRQATGTVEVPDEEILRARTAYWGLVTRMDAMIGEILEALRPQRPRRQHPDPLHLRPRGAGGRARPVVEADVLRGLGEGPGHTVLARRPAAGRALRSRRQLARPQRHPARCPRRAAAAPLARTQHAGAAARPRGSLGRRRLLGVLPRRRRLRRGRSPGTGCSSA